MSVREIGDRLNRISEPYVRAVVLFGSRARGEAEERSDVDVLVLHDGCGIDDRVQRRRHLHGLVQKAVGGYFDNLTVLDMEIQQFLNPVEITGLLLNIYWDALPVHDKTGKLQDFLTHVRENIAKSGLRRVKEGRTYRWVLPEPMKEVKIL